MPTENWTIQTTLEWTQEHLRQKGDPNPRLSAQWLLGCATGLSRLELYTHYDRPLTPSERAQLREAIKRRVAGEPLQYIRGTAPFRHLELRVQAGVLIPRPETEVLVDVVLQTLPVEKTVAGDKAVAVEKPVAILDLCTGTGCIALALLHEHPHCHVTAIDIDPAAVALAGRNARELGLVDAARLTVCQGDLACELLQSPAAQAGFDVLVANPPYVPTALLQELPQEVAAFEPALALDGGADGLALFRRIVEQAVVLLKPGGLLACELHEDALAQAAALCEPHFDAITIHQDLTGRDRIITARMKEKPVAQGSAAYGQPPIAQDPIACRQPPAAQDPTACGEPLAAHVLSLDPQNPPADLIAQAAAVLRAGKPLIFPTDTVYGIGVLVSHATTPKALYVLKQRDPHKAIPLLIPDAAALDASAVNIPPYARQLAKTHWPGALTLILEAAPTLPAHFIAQDGTVALRVPASPVVQALLRAVDAPLATSSANTQGEAPATSLQSLDPLLAAQVTLILDGGVVPLGAPSTIVSCLGDEPQVLRQGALKLES